MPISAIILQPGSPITPTILPAYRPVLFRIKATRTDNKPVPPVVYCDIYFNDTYYKSISATQYAQLNAADSEWQFDISDSCQEYLKRDLPTNGGSTILTADKYVAKVFCRFRSSGYDANNFISPEDVAPIQGTGSVVPTNGSGTESESFLVINSTLQHEDSQDLLTHLLHAINNGTFDPDAYPLTHRPGEYKLCKNDSDYFPFIYMGNGPFLKICVSYKLKGGTNTITSCYNIPQICDSVVSNVQLLLQDNDDILVYFQKAGSATNFEYRIDNGSWLTVPSSPFTIKFQQLLMYLITEAGEQIITDQTGNILIPQDVTVYDSLHTIEIRPRCANGVYGASGNNTINIPSVVDCAPAQAFDLINIDYVTKQINFSLIPPAGKNDFQLQWVFNYGGGAGSLITQPVTVDLTLVGNGFSFPIPDGFPRGGKFVFRERTKCADNSFSQYSPFVEVPYLPPVNQVQLVIASITNDNNGSYNIHLTLSKAVADAITARGYYQADSNSGTIQTFGFNIIIPAGQTDAYGNSPYAPGGGSAVVSSARIEIVNPNPTSAGEKIIF